MELAPMRVHEGTIAFMFESAMMMPLTDYAMKRSGKLHGTFLAMMRYAERQLTVGALCRARAEDVGQPQCAILEPY
jgi:hypothetical protein